MALEFSGFFDSTGGVERSYGQSDLASAFRALGGTGAASLERMSGEGAGHAEIRSWLIGFFEDIRAMTGDSIVDPYAVVDGQIIAANAWGGDADYDYASAPWYRMALDAGGDVVYTDAYIDAVHNRTVITLAIQSGSRGDVLAFLVSDGEKSVFVFGSAGMAEGERYPQGADLLIFPYQGRAHMERELLPFLRALRPRTVAIDHFDDAFPPVSQRVDTGGFLPAVQGNLPSCSAYIPQENIWYEV